MFFFSEIQSSFSSFSYKFTYESENKWKYNIFQASFTHMNFISLISSNHSYFTYLGGLCFATFVSLGITAVSTQDLKISQLQVIELKQPSGGTTTAGCTVACATVEWVLVEQMLIIKLNATPEKANKTDEAATINFIYVDSNQRKIILLTQQPMPPVASAVMAI